MTNNMFYYTTRSATNNSYTHTFSYREYFLSSTLEEDDPLKKTIDSIRRWIAKSNRFGHLENMNHPIDQVRRYINEL